jgi:hypothetical protein
VDDPQTTWRLGFIGIIREAITNTRPEHERWSVQIAAPLDGVTRVQFSRGTEPPAAISVVLADDLTSYRVLYSTACRFLRQEWSGAIPRRY